MRDRGTHDHVLDAQRGVGGEVEQPRPLGKPEFSAHLPKIQAAKPDVFVNVAPGADNIALHKQIKSFGMDKTMKLVQPLLWISYLKEGGPELYQDVYGAINWYWELQDSIPSAKKFVEASMKKLDIPGASLALVDGGRVVYEGGLGVRELGHGRPNCVSNCLQEVQIEAVHGRGRPRVSLRHAPRRVAIGFLFIGQVGSLHVE
jgi:hypothetical protein